MKANSYAFVRGMLSNFAANILKMFGKGMQMRDSHTGNLIKALNVLVSVNTASQKIGVHDPLVQEGWCRHSCVYAGLSVFKYETSL